MSLDRPVDVATTWAEPRTWTIVVDQLGRPLLANACQKLPGIAASKKREPWRDATAVMARAQRIPNLERIAVTAQARYKNRRSPSDTDACSPAVKGCIDGLVVAGVVPGDGREHVASVTYLAAEVGTGLPDALILKVEPAP